MNQVIYVTGHRHPDTDSVAAAIAYSSLKKRQGLNCIPCRLGELNDETKYLLDRFGFEQPYHLKDARVTLSEIQLSEPVMVQRDTTIYETVQLMEGKHIPMIAVVDEQEHFLGIVTYQDISMVGMGDTSFGIDLLKQTTIEAIAKTLNGKIVYASPQTHLNGKVSIVAMTKHGLDNYEVKDRIVMLGDDTQAQVDAIEKGAGLLIVVWAQTIDEKVIALAKEKQCSIVISGHGAMNTSRYLYFAPPIHLLMNEKVISFHEWEVAEDVLKKMLKTRFRTYPVLDQEEKYVGYVMRYDILNSKNKSIVMVDHNEFSQSVRAIEKAELLEVIDHHRISDFSTQLPVSFRNEIVGSTATILTEMFQERQIFIEKNLAGLLLGAIISDTLKFRSPTTTQKDIFMANILAQIAGLNIDEFAEEMFTVSTDISNKTMEEALRTDIKQFDIEDQNVLISQVIIYNYHATDNREAEIEEACQTILSRSEAQTIVAVFTSIIDSGSVVFAKGKCAKWVYEAFPEDATSFQEGLLSRKNQIIPKLADVFSHH